MFSNKITIYISEKFVAIYMSVDKLKFQIVKQYLYHEYFVFSTQETSVSVYSKYIWLDVTVTIQFINSFITFILYLIYLI